MKQFWICLIAILMLGCAATYKPPVLTPTEYTGTISASKERLFNLTKQVLAMEGYQIQNSDEKSGTITTSFRQKKLNEAHCDCGTTMGLPYIKDNRTVTNVALGIIVEDNKLIIKANITGEYLKSVDAVQSITFDCASTGLIEKEMFEKIQNRASL